ncbi:hypothetical protein GCM10017690_33180 [Microbacterium terregens]
MILEDMRSDDIESSFCAAVDASGLDVGDHAASPSSGSGGLSVAFDEVTEGDPDGGGRISGSRRGSSRQRQQAFGEHVKAPCFEFHELPAAGPVCVERRSALYDIDDVDGARDGKR